MKIETFHQRLRENKAAGYDYQVDGKTGMIGIWHHNNMFVLTWEEFPNGDFYNEQNYTRDEVHHFQTVEDVIQFMEANNLNPTQFKP